MKHRVSGDGPHAALQIAQARDRILNLPCSLFDNEADEIARDQTHAMHPWTYRQIGEKAL